MPKRYQYRLPIVAMQLSLADDYESLDAIKEWMGARNHIGTGKPDLGIFTKKAPQGVLVLHDGDWVVMTHAEHVEAYSNDDFKALFTEVPGD